MSMLEQIFADTFRSGGSLIFVREKAPRDLERRLECLRKTGLGAVSFCLRSLAEFKKIPTSCRDLVIFFAEQGELLAELAIPGGPGLAGQRLCFVSKELPLPRHELVDFISTESSLEIWERSLARAWEQVGTRDFKNFAGSFESPCLFLDRDDVLVRNVPYNNDPTKVELLPGAVELIRGAHDKNYWVAVVTNQSGLGRGRISWREFQQVHQQMLQLLAQKGAWIDEVLWASYVAESPTEEGRLFAGLRKPRDGMFQKIRQKLRVNMSRSVMIGDSATDLIAAFAAGVGQLYLVKSEKLESERQALAEFQKSEPALVFKVLNSLESVNDVLS